VAETGANFELAHVLFMDVVGYSQMLIDDQREVLRDLNAIVRGTEQFRAAEAHQKLLCLPTGDGMVSRSLLRQTRRHDAQSRLRGRCKTIPKSGSAWEFIVGRSALSPM
jgi:hypothetical protein